MFSVQAGVGLKRGLQCKIREEELGVERRKGSSELVGAQVPATAPHLSALISSATKATCRQRASDTCLCRCTRTTNAVAEKQHHAN
jgi:hypothetical protein